MFIKPQVQYISMETDIPCLVPDHVFHSVLDSSNGPAGERGYGGQMTPFFISSFMRTPKTFTAGENRKRSLVARQSNDPFSHAAKLFNHSSMKTPKTFAAGEKEDLFI